jgi:protocatechuate 3,4-dioxygenase, beta subunit
MSLVAARRGCSNEGMPTPRLQRRLLLAAACAASLPLPALASSRRALAPMTDGPFYPSAAWRTQWTDWDADLTRVQRGTQVLQAKGELLGLAATVADTRGRIVDKAEVEIWQCDTMEVYRHPRGGMAPGRFDEGFQGFGAATSGADGALRFRTIRPVAYPGRTPHIHIKLRHASFGELTTQLFVAGDAGNARDFLWRQLDAEERAALEMKLVAAPSDSGQRWLVTQALTVPA